MDDEQKAITDRNRARQAQELLEHPLFKEAFGKLHDELMNRWRETGTAEADTLKRERIWQAVNLLGKIQDIIGKVIENGKVAKAHLAAIEGKRQHAA
jgi:uncharacterized protein YjbJ (UPF0337 family)